MKLLIQLFVIVVLMIACKDDTVSSNEGILIGTWYFDNEGNEPGTALRSQVQYLSDNTFEALGLIVDKNSDQIIGYFHKQVGEYSINGDVLTSRVLEAYTSTSTNTPYAVKSITDLVPYDALAEHQEHFRLNSGGSRLTLTFPDCGPYENCIKTLTFTKFH